MDLSRLNIPSLAKLGHRYRHFREFLAQVLEGERTLLDPTAEVENEHPEFFRNDDVSTASRDLSRLASSGRADVASVFAHLAPYFEAGFSLRREAGHLKLESMFLFGRVFAPPGADEPIVDFGLGRSKIEGVIRGRVNPILREAHLEKLEALATADALAFEPTAGRVFVLVSDRPHPWQVGAIETIFFDVRNALTARAPVKPAPLRKFFR